MALRMHLLTVMLTAAMAGGCAWLQGRALHPIPREAAHLMLTQPASVSGIRYHGPSLTQDYLWLGGDGWRAELLYTDAAGLSTAIEYRGLALRRLTEGWTLNADGIAAWSKPRTLITALAPFTAVRFRPVAGDRECAAYQALWGSPPGDPQRRPGKLVFGYYCAAPGVALTEPRLDAFLHALRVGHVADASKPAPLRRPEATPSVGQGYRPFPRLFPTVRPAPRLNRPAPD